VIKAEFPERFVDGAGDVINVDDDLGGDVELLTGDFGLFDGDTLFFFRVVNFGTIKVVVANFDGCLGGVDQTLIMGACFLFVPVAEVSP
jgi:hypothetical protein